MRPLIKRVSAGVWVAVGLTLLYAVYFSLTTILQYRTFHYSAYDLGLNAQGMWLASRFDGMFSSIRGMNYFGDHLWLLIVALSPVYWLAPSIETLLILQSIALAVGAVPLAMLAQRKTGHPWMAGVLAAAWLLSPALQNMNLEHYHPEIFATPLLMWAIERADAEKWRGYWIAIALALLAKEDIALTVFALGVYLFIAKDRRRGTLTMAFGVLSFVLSMKVLLPYFNGQGFFRMQGGYWFSDLWAGKSSLAYYLEVLTREQAWRYALNLFAPAAFLSFLAPGMLIGLLPSLVINVLSGSGYLSSIDYHYNNQTLPFVYAATAFGLGRLASSRGTALGIHVTSVAEGDTAVKARHVNLRVPRTLGLWVARVLTCVLLLAAIIGNMTLSQLPIQRMASRMAYLLDLLQTSEAVRDFKEIQATAEARPHLNISATHNVVPQLSARDNIYMYPNPFQAEYWGIAGENLPNPDIIDMLILDLGLVETGHHADLLRAQIDSGQFRATKRKGRFLVLERNSPPVPPATPDVLTAAPPPQGVRVTAFHDPDRIVYGMGPLLGLTPAAELQTNAAAIPATSGGLALADGQPLPGTDNTQMVFSGEWTAAGLAPLQLRIRVDDGCRILIDGKLAVDRSGVHSFEEVWISDPMKLSSGKHHLVIEYFEWGGQAGLQIEWAQPGQPFRPLVAGDILP